MDKVISIDTKSKLRFVFWDKDIGSLDDKIGEAEISFDELSKLKLNDKISLQTSSQLNKCIIRLEKK